MEGPLGEELRVLMPRVKECLRRGLREQLSVDAAALSWQLDGLFWPPVLASRQTGFKHQRRSRRAGRRRRALQARVRRGRRLHARLARRRAPQAQALRCQRPSPRGGGAAHRDGGEWAERGDVGARLQRERAQLRKRRERREVEDPHVRVDGERAERHAGRQRRQVGDLQTPREADQLEGRAVRERRQIDHARAGEVQGRRVDAVRVDRGSPATIGSAARMGSQARCAVR